VLRDRARRLEFLYKVVGRGTQGSQTLKPGDMLDMVGPLGAVSRSTPNGKNIVVLGRGVGLATDGADFAGGE
jgi:dihydroorotate dehydrogenase electron transfer subunit